MSKVKIQGNASGTGVLTVEAPNTNTDRTVTLPDSTGTLLMTDGDGSSLTGISGGATDIDGLSDAVAGSYHIGLGSASLDSLTSGHGNYAFGTNAGTALTTGDYNIAIGDETLDTATTSDGNIAIGSAALHTITDGQHNVAVGRNASRFITTGYENASIGWNSLYSNTTGYRNSGLGKSGLESTTTGHHCTGVGYYAQSTSATASNEMTLGNTNVSNLRCNDTTISSLSDQRDKAEVTDLPDEAGLDLINSLRPVTFYWDRREWYEDGVTDGSKIKRDYRSWKPNSGQRQGFIAQEVESAISGHKYLEDSEVVNGTEDKKEFAPAHLLTNAIKAIQQLSAEVDTLKAEIATLKGA